MARRRLIVPSWAVILISQSFTDLLEFFRKAYRRVGIVNQRRHKIEIGGRNGEPTFSAIRQAAVLHAHDACLRLDLNSGGTAVKKRQKNIKLDWFVDRRARGREEKGAGQTDVARQSLTLDNPQSPSKQKAY